MLPEYPQLALFLTATVILNLTPGSDVLYIASQSFLGSKQGIFAALGISTGIIIYVVATAFGLSEVFHNLPLIFELIKLIGALYLFYLAWRAFFKTEPIRLVENHVQSSFLKSYYVGFFNSLLNPKVGLFFITFLPQFSDTARGKIWLQLLSLGGCFIISGTIINIMYALLISHSKDRLFKKSKIQSWLNKATGILFFGLALKVLTARQN